VLSINRALIQSEEQTLERYAKVRILPETLEPSPRLEGSYMAASRQFAVPGSQFDYTIRIRNSGIGRAKITVTNPLPAKLSYVRGSSRPEALYNEETRTLIWNDVLVPAAGDISLSFGALGSPVSSSTPVVNTASIAAGDDCLARTTTVWLVPRPPEIDGVPPVVDAVTIGDKDILQERAVTLHVSAYDDVCVEKMFIREWVWQAADSPQWTVAQSSGWIPYRAELPWTLGSGAGTHYVGVWVADKAGNRSRLDSRSLDFASLVVPEARLPQLRLAVYLVRYDAGVEVSAELTPMRGVSSISVWSIGALDKPLSADSRQLSFTTQQAGSYLFMIHGQPGAEYHLSVRPEGGPRSKAGTNPPEAPQADSAEGYCLAGNSSLLGLLAESGLDPLGTSGDPNLPQLLFIPLLAR
jgi:uncharacterized repeat protein (TIGR01451 family)